MYIFSYLGPCLNFTSSPPTFPPHPSLFSVSQPDFPGVGKKEDGRDTKKEDKEMRRQDE
jgi:hypothetical protein